MHLLSINIGEAELPVGAGDPYLSGIAKRSVERPVRIGVEGIPGDAICDPRYHGGSDQDADLYGAGDEVFYEPPGGDSLPIIELYRDAFAPAKEAAILRRHLPAPLAVRPDYFPWNLSRSASAERRDQERTCP